MKNPQWRHDKQTFCNVCIAIILIIVSFGCRHLGLRKSIQSLPLGSKAYFQIFPPIHFHPPIDTLYSVTIFHNRKKFQCLLAIESDPEKLVIVGLTPVATRLFSLTYLNGDISYEASPEFSLPAPPEFILGILELMLGPSEIIKANLIGKDINWVEEASPLELRQIFKKDLEIVRISYNHSSPSSGKTITLDHYPWRLRVQLSDFESLPNEDAL